MIKLLVVFMRWVATWPLPRVRAWGAGFGRLLWWLALRRRHIVRVNLRLCFPELPLAERERLARAHFVAFGQSVLDRAWLWHAPESVLRERLRWTGPMESLADPQRLVIFAPHFVGLDAGGMAVLLHFFPARVAFIFMAQSNSEIERWVRAGRERTGTAQPYFRREGMRKIVAGLKRGEPLHLSPDMDFGRDESVFVPFMGVPAATLPSLHRMARVGGARVVPVVTRMTDRGYSVEALEPLQDFPGPDVLADTARTNQLLDNWVRSMPEQYHWAHRRFKTRPEGEPAVYGA